MNHHDDSGRGATEDNPYTFGPPHGGPLRRNGRHPLHPTGRFIFRHGQPAGYTTLHEIPFMPDLANDICDVLWRHEQAERNPPPEAASEPRGINTPAKRNRDGRPKGGGN